MNQSEISRDKNYYVYLQMYIDRKNPITNSVQLSSLFGHKQRHRHTLYRSPLIWVQGPRCLVTCLTIQPHLCPFVCVCVRVSASVWERERRISKQLNQCSPMPQVKPFWSVYEHVTSSSCFVFFSGCSVQ